LASFVGVAPEDDDGTSASGARPARTRDVADDRAPKRSAPGGISNLVEPKVPHPDPAVVETVRVQVLGIVKRPSKSGEDVFVITGDDQRTYQTHQAAGARDAKAAKKGPHPK